MPDPMTGRPDIETWTRAAALFDWDRWPDAIWEPGPGHGQWFVGGRVSLAANLVDRHARDDDGRIAIRWEGEPGERRELTYVELAGQVRTLARALRRLGVTDQSRVALHLGAVPEVVVAMLACTRLGASYELLPVSVASENLADRLHALEPTVVFTQDGAWRRGLVLPLKNRCDDALTAVAGVESTVVVRRTGMDVAWFEGDHWYHELAGVARPGRLGRQHPPPRAYPADQPLLSARLPSHLGQQVSAELGVRSLVAAASLHHGGFGDGTVLWCAGDLSWPGTQLHGILGPLAMGDTIVLSEGTLDVPTVRRAWQIMADFAVTTLITVPSVLRWLRDWSTEVKDTPACPQLRRVVTAGEELDAQLRSWAAGQLAGYEVSTADAWGQIELGGVVRVDDALDPAYLPDAGMVVVDDTGRRVPDGDVGDLVVSRPWAGAMMAASDPHGLLAETHWGRHPGVYSTGDRARWTPAGSFAYFGRTDPVVSVSGQLVSLHEVTTVLVEHPFVLAADVIERPGRSGARHLAAAIVLDNDQARGHARPVTDVLQSVRDSLGGLACPRVVLLLDRFGDELRGDERRRALSLLPLPIEQGVVEVTWDDVVSAAELLP